MKYQKSNQVKKKTHKTCITCKKELEVKHFATPRTRMCEFCKLLVKMEKQNDQAKRKTKRIEKKKQKSKVILSIPELKKKVQRKVNSYVRERDKDLPCISCQKMFDKKEAGHFIAQGSSGKLRYLLQNIHGQCTGCNHYKRGNLLEYRINLVKKIGIDEVEWLEEHRHDTHKYTRDELERIMEHVR